MAASKKKKSRVAKAASAAATGSVEQFTDMAPPPTPAVFSPMAMIMETLPQVEYEQLVLRRDEITDRLAEIRLPVTVLPKKRKLQDVVFVETTEAPPSRPPDDVDVVHDESSGEAQEVAARDPPDAAAPTTPAMLPNTTNVVPVSARPDVHWDYVMKEMQWLATDFAAERKRHVTQSRKLSHSVTQYWKQQASRVEKQIQHNREQIRKTARHISTRVVKPWWAQLDKIVAYTQKLSLDQQRAADLEHKLVQIVQQTESYTRSLARGHKTGESDINAIEAALQGGGAGQRLHKKQPHDYARLQLVPHEEQFMGESTEESGSDGSYHDSDDSDDESTLLAAQREETQLRFDDDERSYAPDPDEVQALLAEGEMDVDDVLQRWAAERQALLGNEEDDEADERLDDNVRARVVTFADDGENDSADNAAADDDVPMSNDEEEDYEDVGLAVDDETTMEQEEALPQEMTRAEELELLQADNAVSIDELRARYVAALHANPNDDDESSSINDDDDDKENHVDSHDDGGGSESMLAAADPAEGDDGDDREFEPLVGDDVDDETTMEAEERLGRDMTYADEIALLERENTLSVDELRAMYASMENDDASESYDVVDIADEPEYAQYAAEPYEASELTRLLSTTSGHGVLADRHYNQSDGDDDEEEYEHHDEVDDEATMEAEERLERDMSYADEIAMLQRESEMSVEQLRALYTVKRSDAASVDDASDTTAGGGGKADNANESVEDPRPSTRSSSDALATPTLASRPFILAPWVKLRQYQHVGLNWLVSLQSRRLNGILADEMGLGKTLQTISLLSYLACYKGLWGPHLIVVPTSVIVNWETEFKRFAPALKVLCYYGPAKRRKELRSGWTKSNWYHVVITSYQLAVQDAFAFKRKKWYYLVLDEAQNIKNFASQRWQTLVGFSSQRRLLLTGTPLQNSLMELWSLCHFIMPYIFRSRKEFSYWFANPMTSMIEGTASHNIDVVSRLHAIIRPFVLRRLKKDVEKQMPGKYEHIIKCQLSRRQMFIYEEFMARSSTRQALRKSGNFMGMMNVLMQLRKVCNHPDLFEPRSIVTPFTVTPVALPMPALILDALDRQQGADSISASYRFPLWCGSQGWPSFSSSLRHDVVESSILRRLRQTFPVADLKIPSEETTSGIAAVDELWVEIKTAALSFELAKQDCCNHENTRRCCAAPFRLSNRLLVQCDATAQIDDVLCTPEALMAAKRSQNEIAEAYETVIRKFVLCVPKASAVRPRILVKPKGSRAEKDESLLKVLEGHLRPFSSARARLSSFFPDKSLVQFDAGKLQTLAELLRELKSGGHRALIFTQMSKMLDILEAFLNLNGHTYLRLDGATGVDKRQRLMDRFNSDPKVFCFILSTRSGGLGVNLTGADSVIFYDSDWNPAMDAQAQDRAHRIGQTRDVHIFRLITEHTIEENILAKAKQKRNLDILVMDRGNFNASQLFNEASRAVEADVPDSTALYSKSNLRLILGADSDTPDAEIVDAEEERSNDRMEAAMTKLEDDDDVKALRGAQQEAVDDLKEFDESLELPKDQDTTAVQEDAQPKDRDDQTKEVKTSEKAGDTGDNDEETKLSAEFAVWQSSGSGTDVVSIENSLGPTERYAFRFRKEIDPYYSIFAVLEYRRRLEAEAETAEDVDIDEIERAMAADEKRAIADGDLLATNIQPHELIRHRNMYRREKIQLRAEKKRRQLTGENWEIRIDGATDANFWYNVDTGEATWDKPATLLDLEAYDEAQEGGWKCLPQEALLHVMSFLVLLPDRFSCSTVCKSWRSASHHPCFVIHVYPVEMGALTRDSNKFEPNHVRTIEEAVERAFPGDTIELADGHYWVNGNLTVDIPLKFVGDEHSPENVVVELGGSILWTARGGWCEGITFRRPKLANEATTDEMLQLSGNARLNVFASVFDNQGRKMPLVRVVGNGQKGVWEKVALRSGAHAFVFEGASLDLRQVTGKGVVV